MLQVDDRPQQCLALTEPVIVALAVLVLLHHRGGVVVVVGSQVVVAAMELHHQAPGSRWRGYSCCCATAWRPCPCMRGRTGWCVLSCWPLQARPCGQVLMMPWVVAVATWFGITSLSGSSGWRSSAGCGCRPARRRTPGCSSRFLPTWLQRWRRANRLRMVALMVLVALDDQAGCSSVRLEDRRWRCTWSMKPVLEAPVAASSSPWSLADSTCFHRAGR